MKPHLFVVPSPRDGETAAPVVPDETTAERVDRFARLLDELAATVEAERKRRTRFEDVLLERLAELHVDADELSEELRQQGRADR